jgi:cytochrome c biogenesis protein CcmG/thiol:disulfide interchange protein DsbE
VHPTATDRLLRTGLIAAWLAFVFVLYGAIREIVINPGDSAPEFTVLADGNKPVSLPDFHGKALLLNFWATWCEPCRIEIPSLNALARKLGPRGLVILAVSSDSVPSAYSNFLKQTPLAFLTLRQPEKPIQNAYGTAQVPETYLIDRNGVVRSKFISNQDWTSPELIAQVESLL